MQLNFSPPGTLTPFFLSQKFASFAVGPYGCLRGDTLVITEHGPTPIADIDRPMRVLSWNAKTSRFQLSQASIAFPKGTGYLYRVSTPQGEFVAAGSHRLLCADGEYRRVEDLRTGDAVTTCSGNRLRTTGEFARKSSLSDVPSLTTSIRPILSITRETAKEIYWDIQVDETHNYVTIDGAVHHNSTKTTCGLMKIAYEASRMAPCIDGVRRSRCVVVRNTRQMLWDTTVKDFLKWFPDGTAGTLRKTDSAFDLMWSTYDPVTGAREKVHCEVLFRGLDEANDVRRLLSLQLSFGVIDEFKEVHPDIYEALAGRVGRYPDKVLVPPRPEWGVDDKGDPRGGCVDDRGESMKKIWGMSNPPDADSWWEELLSSPPSNMHVTIQPSGLSPEADWVHLLDSGYYEDLAELHANDPDWIDVFIHGQFGKSLSGQPVFRTFNRDIHVAKAPLTPLPTTLVIGVDAGLNPTATITQQTHDGRILVLDSITGVDGGMGALRFARERLRPLLVNKYPRHQVAMFIDPAAFQRAQTDEKSVADIFRAEGFVTKPAPTNNISARIAAVDNFLTRQINGNIGLLIDPGCTGMITALRSKYRYKITNKGEREEKPDKNHPWSDYCFVAGTPVLTPGGYRPIDSLRVGDPVCVPDGIDYVAATGGSVASALVCVELTDGTSLVCTPDHPFILSNTRVLRADALSPTDSLATVEDGKWASGRWRTRQSGQLLVRASSAVGRLKYLLGVWLRAKANTVLGNVTNWATGRLMALSTMVCGSPELGRMSTIGTSAPANDLFLFTDTCGNNTTGQYRKDAHGISSTRLKSSPTVKRVVSLSEGTRVYNLTTARTHTYYVGSVLVHNCDSLQYACLAHDNGGIFGARVYNAKRELKRVSHAGWT